METEFDRYLELYREEGVPSNLYYALGYQPYRDFLAEAREINAVYEDSRAWTIDTISPEEFLDEIWAAVGVMEGQYYHVNFYPYACGIGLDDLESLAREFSEKLSEYSGEDEDDEEKNDFYQYYERAIESAKGAIEYNWNYFGDDGWVAYEEHMKENWNLNETSDYFEDTDWENEEDDDSERIFRDGWTWPELRAGYVAIWEEFEDFFQERYKK